MAGELRLRRGVRAVVLDDHDRVLLVHFEFARPPHEVAELWATPGGGVEDGEDDRGALARELALITAHGSLGSPRRRSAITLRWISLAPPAIDSARLPRKPAIQGPPGPSVSAASRPSRARPAS